MDPNYRESCREGYFTGGERDDARQHQMPHFTHQLPYHSNLVSSLQQPAIVLEQSDVQRNREDFSGSHANPSMLRSIYSGSGSILPSPNILLQSTNHFASSNNQHPQHPQHQQHQQQLNRLQPTTRPHFIPPSTTHLAGPNLAVDATVAQHIDPGIERTETSRDSLDATLNEPLELSTPRQHQDTSSKTLMKDKVAVPPKPPNPILQPKHLNLMPTPQPKSLLPPLRRRDRVQPRSGGQLPEFLAFKYLRNEKENIVGVVAKDNVDEGMEFGPYNGNFLDEEIGSTKSESTWELCTGGKVFLYMDGKKKDQLIWMSYVQSARNEQEQNLEACQYYGQIYFRTTKCIEPGSELRVFYSKEYSESIGFKSTLKDLDYHEEDDYFQCNSCESQFPTAKRMFRHMKFDHEQDSSDDLRPVITWKVKCKTECTKSEELPSSGFKDIETEPTEGSSQVYSPGQFICTICGKKFPTEGRLEAHSMFHEFSEEHTCIICGEKQRNSRALTKHMAKHETVVHKCRKCDKSYKCRNSLLRHNREAHILGRKQEKGSLKDEQTQREYNKDADTIWKKKKYRKTPKSEPNPGLPAEVPGETKVTNDSNPGTKAAPRKRVAKAKPTPEEPKDMLGKTVTYYNRPRPFKCRHCPRRYRSKTAVLEHEREVHENKGTYKCNLCPRVFVKESNFFQHYQSHEQNRLYRCSLCPRAFASDSALANHQGEHTGLKPFKCEICGKGFRIRKWVCAHKRRMHQTRELRFFCSFCNKGFTDKGPLQKHELRHKGIRPFVCMICGKGFGVKYVLEVHMQSVHAAEKKYQCEVCGKKFSLNQHYVTHIFKHRAQGEDIPGLASAQEGQEN
ncbi:histone-lysine N-methyltransferase PRDM9-like [Lytechinus variegatus]|uniref:histone-lysine N-methyltransferase PRDM9-like n=1 Tax=Lytechinus variegatus TaxID=7654 RepID=UPI001BB252CC|nr:histone-lysine N-methyltransferase PRDM9-like [Lytechinus variegatus]XP_041470219.1 histone-lysine N-methyltransferase PRDM9-like [Lytechinus variegatus]